MFYLAGSKYFGTDTEKSDTDYVAQDTPFHHELCQKLGMKRVTESKWVKYHSFRVDVLLVLNIESTLYAREMAFLHCPKADKKTRHAYILEAIKEQEAVDATSMV
jgi:hypothetical protein